MKSSEPYAAFLRAMGGEELRETSKEEFEDMVSQLISRDGPIGQILRNFHTKHGRYPTLGG